MLLLCALAVFSAACANTSVDAPASPPGVNNEDAGAGADGGVSDTAIQLAFMPAKLTLMPKESTLLTVRATLKQQDLPAAQLPIRFALLGGEDAVLDAIDAQTDAEGIAHVTLIAPSKPTSFDVRAASSGGGQVRLNIMVNASGVTALRVQPSYSGQRTIRRWTATAHTGVICSELAGNPPPDGARLVTGAPGANTLALPVPVDVALAVTVRSGHYIGGCVNVPPLSEGADNQVLVYASDRPLNLAATNLSLSFGATDAHPAFDKLLQASASAAASALLGRSKSDVAALLDGMRDATPAPNLDAFDLARASGGWDSALESAFGKGAARRLRDPAERWLSAGLLALNAPDALIGTLSPLANGASFTPSAVGTATPSDVGFTGSFVTNWSADSNDTVLLGMELNWQPSRLVTALAVEPALLEFPDATSIELALAQSVGCAQVGAVLLANGESPGNTTFDVCDQSCTIDLCQSAVAAAWSNAQLSSGAQIDTLSVTATGAAEVGDDARATSLTGNWVGQLHTESGSAQVSGALSANSSR